MTSPYEQLAPRAFWRLGVTEQSPETVVDLYRKKFPIEPTARIATAGSCFAQHISRHLQAKGYNVLDLEPPPEGLATATARKFGYSLYSARFGNIYAIRQLLQLLLELKGRFEPADWIWEREGRYFDALRPGIEPTGLDSPEEVKAHRTRHLQAVRQMTRAADVFIFTFGLTEAWIHEETGTVYATAPGTIAGQYDKQKHKFKNFTFEEIYSDFAKVRAMFKRRKKNMRFIVTVSPVPLTATASNNHVLAATIYSKSVLRAVAGQLQNDFDDVDYFPSYELIASHFSRGEFYESNLRSITDAGVSTAMRVFLSEHSPGDAVVAPAAVDQSAKLRKKKAAAAEDDVVCEDILLDAFARG